MVYSTKWRLNACKEEWFDADFDEAMHSPRRGWGNAATRCAYVWKWQGNRPESHGWCGFQGG